MDMLKSLLLCTSVVMISGLVACSNSGDVQPTSDGANGATENSDVSQSDGLPEDAPTYLVALEPYPPYTLKDEVGAVIGYDADILAAIGKQRGFRVKLLSRPWEGIFETLEDGSRQIIASGAILNDERKANWGYTSPYSDIKMALFVPEGSSIKTPADMAGKKIAVQVDSAMSAALEEFSEQQTFDFDTLFQGSVYLALKATARGDADAFWATDKVGKYYVNGLLKSGQSGEKFNIIDVGSTAQPIVFFLRKDNKKLIEEMNVGLEEIKKNGEFDTINQKWFGD